jgi:hypothetical protein
VAHGSERRSQDRPGAENFLFDAQIVDEDAGGGGISPQLAASFMLGIEKISSGESVAGMASSSFNSGPIQTVRCPEAMKPTTCMMSRLMSAGGAQPTMGPPGTARWARSGA